MTQDPKKAEPGLAPADRPPPRRRWVLIGDGESPHLLKWAEALQASGRVDLWAVSSRGFLTGFDPLLPPERRLALGHAPRAAGGNAAVLRHLPRLGRWLAEVRPDVLHAHYLTSHGTLAWLARSLWRLDAALVASAWGSDILVAPRRWALRRVTRRVLRAAVLTTSDSQHMAQAMRALGAGEVMTFPFGLAALPPPPPDAADREAGLVYANRGLEPIYRPDRVLDLFEALLAREPRARLVIAHDGSLRPALEARCALPGSALAGRVHFVGRLDADAQAGWYRRAEWFFSLPASDSVSVSVIEALAHGALPVLSDLPANRELVRHGENGLILPDTDTDTDTNTGPDAAWWAAFDRLRGRADAARAANRQWVADHARFPQAVARFLDRAEALLPGPGAGAPLRSPAPVRP